jgi:Fe-S-cluster containining protein
MKMEIEIHERPKPIEVSKTLADHLRHSPPGTYHRVRKALEDSIKYVSELPQGPLRARVINAAIQKSLDVAFRNDPPVKGAISCFGCTRSGCCHTNVDITQSEAELLADRVPEAALPRLEMQAALPDADSTKAGYFEAWRKLSFEDRACVFLVEGRCSVYEDRPGVCRKWFITEDPKTL